MKFEINRIGIQSIAEMLQNISFESIFTLTEDQIKVALFDSARSKLVFVEYPIKIVEGEPVEFALNTDWLYKKLKKVDGSTLVCEVTGTNFIFNQKTTIKNINVRNTFELNLLDLENSSIQSSKPENEPTVKQSVEFVLEDVSILKRALDAIDGDHFVIYADAKEVTIKSEPDLSGPPSTSIIEIAPSVLESEVNRTMHKNSEVANFVKSLSGVKEVKVSFIAEGPLTIEAVGDNVRFKFLSSPVEE